MNLDLSTYHGVTYSDIPLTVTTSHWLLLGHTKKYLVLFFRALANFLAANPTEINTIIPCKGIGVLHLAVGVDPEWKSRECTELLLKHGGDPNLW